MFYLNLCILYNIGTDRHREAKGSREGGRNTEEDRTIWSREERTGEQDPDGTKADGEGQFQETGADWQWNVPCTRESTSRCKLLQARMAIPYSFQIRSAHARLFVFFFTTNRIWFGLCRILKEADANRLKLTPEYLELRFIESIANNSKIFFGEKVLTQTCYVLFFRFGSSSHGLSCELLLCRFLTWSWIKGCSRITLMLFLGRTIMKCRSVFRELEAKDLFLVWDPTQ